MSGVAHFLSKRGWTLGFLQRSLIVLSDCSTALYGCAFAIVVCFKYYHKYGRISLGIGYASLWAIGEIISMVTTFMQRYFFLFDKVDADGKKMEKMLGLKLLGVFHYLLITVGTAGFVSAYIVDKSDDDDYDNVSYMFRAVSASLFLAGWTFASIIGTTLCMAFSLYWGTNTINVGSILAIENNSKAFYNGLHQALPCLCLMSGCIYYPMQLVLMIINQIIRVFFMCPFYFVEAHYDGMWRCVAFLPIVVLNLVTLPIRAVGCFLGLLIQAIGWVLFVSTCGLSVMVVRCVLGDKPTNALLKLRETLWAGHPLKWLPALLPLVAYVALPFPLGPSLLAVAIVVYICSLLGDGDPSFVLLDLWKSYTEVCWYTITGQNHGMGFRFDALITGVVLTLVFIPGMLFVSFWVMSLSEPTTLTSACNNILGDHIAEYWIFFKAVQIIVSVLYPLLRLYATGLLVRLKALLAEYPTVLILRLGCQLQEYYLLDLEKQIDAAETKLAELALGNEVRSTRDQQLVQNIQSLLAQWKEIIVDAKNTYSALKDEYEETLMQMRADINAIASILFDFDFSVKSIKKGPNPGDNYDHDAERMGNFADSVDRVKNPVNSI